MGGLAIFYYEDTWKKLLLKDLKTSVIMVYSIDFIEFIDVYLLDSKAIIDEKRVEEAATELQLPPETIRQHYEDIAKEIPLQLSWKAV